MSVLNLLCPICTETFRNVEDIYGTSCGHVFHLICMREWQERSASCPKCRTLNPTTFKLYLSFDETSDAVEELKNTLKNSTQEINQLKIKLNDKDNTLSILRADMEAEIAELKVQILASDRLKETANLKNINTEQSKQILSLTQETLRLKATAAEGEANIAKLTEELKLEVSKNAELSKELVDMRKTNVANVSSDYAMQEDITLKQDLKAIASKLELEVARNSHLTEQCKELKEKNKSSQITINEEKVQILEHRLKHISSEFEKEITKSTQLEIDKIRLQSYIDRMKLNSFNSCTELNYPSSAKMGGLKTPSIASSSESLYSRPDTSRPKKKGAKSPVRIAKKEFLPPPNRWAMHKNPNMIDSTSNSIVIQSYPTEKLTYPLENIVLTLAIHMDISLNIQEIDKVNIVGRNKQPLSQNVSLFVRFKNKEKKNNFLANKSSLRACTNTSLRAVKIKEYIDDRIYDVFLYAKAKLSEKGFNDIFWTNNRVFAKKNMADTAGIQIHTRQQVDEILNNPEASGIEADKTYDNWTVTRRPDTQSYSSPANSLDLLE